MSSLARLVAAFDANPAGVRKLIRARADDSRDVFYREAVHLLASGDTSRGARYVIALLISLDLVAPCVCDPAMSLETAMGVVRLAMQFDGMLDVHLATRMAEGDTTLGEQQGAVLLHILSEISDVTRIMPALTQMLRHPSARLRSKAALLIGRGNKSVPWVQTRMADEDPRIRANAVEALWDVDGPGVRELLRTAALDSSNRVAGNALVALYRLGETGTVRQIRAMAGHLAPVFRATAAWVMGQTEDPRFAADLARMLSDPEPVVRQRVFRSMARIRKAQPAAGLRVVLGRPTLAADESRHCRAVILDAEGEEAGGVPGTRFLVFVDGAEVEEYSVAEHPPPDMLAVAFILPRPTSPAALGREQAIAQCLDWKRKRDAWAFVCYGPGAERASEETLTEGFRFVSHAAGIREALLNAASREHSLPTLWDCLGRVLSSPYPARAARHVVVLTESPLAFNPDMAQLAGVARGSRLRIHALAASPDPLLEELCRATGGEAFTGVASEDLAPRMEQLYLGLLARYDIRWRDPDPAPAAGTGELTVQVTAHSTSGTGSITLG
jgi:hypothetical protein